MRRLSITLASGALAVALVGGAVTAPAGAAPVGGTHGGPGGTADPGPRFQTGSANLDTLAEALSLHHKSVTVVVRAPALLAIARPVDITVVFGGTPVRQAYSRAHGNRFVFNFDAGTGALRREPVRIVLDERDPVTNRILKSFTIDTGADVEALWSVIVNPLRITFWQQCDWHSDADPKVKWLDVTGTLHEMEFDPDLDDTVTISDGFAGIWHEVKASDPLWRPEMGWTEYDWVTEFDPFGAPPFPLLPTEDHDNVFILEDRHGDCSAIFRYSVRVTVRTYPGLPG
jgi:hypothetical protein